MQLQSLLHLVFLGGPIQASVLPGSNNRGLNVDQRQPDRLAKHSIFPQWTWLRDTVIEKLTSPPPKVGNVVYSKSTTMVPYTHHVPKNVLGRNVGDVVLRFNLTTAAEERALAEVADTLFLDIWEFTNDWADIRLREDDIPSLLGLLPISLQKSYSPLMPDLSQTIYNTYPLTTLSEPVTSPSRANGAFTPALKASDGVDNIFFRDYQPYTVIVPWMRLMASMFTTHVQIIDIGKSYEGRDIHALKVGVTPSLADPQPRRKTIIITGGFHAREWISVSTVTFMAWSLITSYGKSPGITKLIQQFDFVFIPTVNPDGYAYTWEVDRLWRKNRQGTSLRFCKGLDLDRAFGFEWNGTSYQSNPCSETYPGDQPFQAVESHGLAEWAGDQTDNNNVYIVGFLDLHSYSQQVLYPYSYSCRASPPSLENLEELAMGIAKSIRISSGEQYSVASACEGAVLSASTSKSGNKASRMETGGGSAIDWFYHELKVRYSYQIKLRDTGSYGFLLPKENIIETGEEAFNALKYFGDYLLGNKGIESTLFKELYEVEKVQDGNVNDGEGDDEVEEGDWELKRRKKR